MLFEIKIQKINTKHVLIQNRKRPKIKTSEKYVPRLKKIELYKHRNVF